MEVLSTWFEPLAAFLGWLESWALPGSLVAPWILGAYYVILGILACYGVHRLVMAWGYWRTRHSTPPRPANPDQWPLVTVQLPIFNEMFVAGRLVDAVCALDYPRDRLEIQVLDDSTDETSELIAEHVERARLQGVNVLHLQRQDRRGYKAGALEEGLSQASGELVAIFDADFVPPADYLRNTVPYFADPEIGMVQARWGHLNRDFSLLTRVQAIFLDGHFVVEHTARHRGGMFFNFNGTAGIWRRQAIVDAGGWEHDTLTEDLDLSYRSQLAGWRFLYLPELVVPAELPIEVAAYKSQQHRWAKGSVQTGRKLLGRVLRAPLPWKVKLEAFVHLTNNWSYALMVALSLLVFPAMYLRRGDESWKLLVFDLPLFMAATVSVLIFYTVSQIGVGAGWQRRLWQLPVLMGMGIGLAVNNTRAVLAGCFSRGGVFHRTPKSGAEGALATTDASSSRRRYRLGKGLSFWIEGLLALYFLLSTGLAIDLGMWLSLPFLYLFLQGYTYMFLLGLLPTRGAAVEAS